MNDMKKMAIFTEGRTELEFNKKLILSIANQDAVTIDSRTIRGGGKSGVRKSIQQINIRKPSTPHGHYILLYDCAGETAVKSQMLGEYKTLSNAGYSKVLCHRDVAPNFTRAELPKLAQGLKLKVPTKPILVEFILSVMEVEAWFLSEHTHFSRFDALLTTETIAATLGFDPCSENMELRDSPAIDLDYCYQIAGKRYDKSTSQATIDSLDFTSVYVGMVEQIAYLRLLCDEISSFLKS